MDQNIRKYSAEMAYNHIITQYKLPKEIIEASSLAIFERKLFIYIAGIENL